MMYLLENESQFFWHFFKKLLVGAWVLELFWSMSKFHFLQNFSDVYLPHVGKILFLLEVHGCWEKNIRLYYHDCLILGDQWTANTFCRDGIFSR